MGRKVAIVTGGSRGIGRGICIALGKAGYTVAVLYRSRTEEAKQTIVELQQLNCTARAYPVDVTCRDQVRTTIARVAEDFGRIDVLVNNAGVASKTSTIELDEAEWDRVVDVNLKGTLLCCQAVIPHMCRQGSGRIINISSIAAQTGGVIGPHYAASKAGIVGLTRFLARELGPSGITVNALAPSGIPTDLLTDLNLPISAHRPVRRVGTVEDVAAAVCYLASENAGYVTGQLLSINGGSFLG